MTRVPPALARLPLIGRAAELAELRSTLERAGAGRQSVVLLRGDPGVGKSRLMTVLAEEAARGPWTVALGRAYPVETGAPYALFSDAFVPLLEGMEPGRRTVLARGAEAQLEHLFPALALRSGNGGGRTVADRSQLFWTFAELLRGLSERQPLLIVLDDLHLADVSSLELLHFLVRHLTHQPIAVIGTVNDAERDAHPTLGETVQSLLSLGAMEQWRLEPLSREATGELVRTVFGVDERVSREFTALLYGWTRGNPYFIEETLKALVESGRLHREGGSWLGWEVSELELPGSVREAIRLRMGRLSGSARRVAELVAVMGTRPGYEQIRDLSGLEEPELVRALEELRSANVLIEEGTARAPVYDFRHPMLRETLHSDIGLARRRLLHASIAEALERRYGPRALEHADELAHHFAQADVRVPSSKAAKYLAAAGRSALARFANREAADYLAAALERLDAEAAPAETPGAAAQEGAEPERFTVLDGLARARQRLGDVRDAIRLWELAREDAERRGDPSGAAVALRRSARAHFRSGRHAEAIEVCDRSLEAATAAAAPALITEARLLRGACLQAVGRVQEARAELEAGLAGAEAEGDHALRARSHRALLLFHTPSGPSDRARTHGARAIELARESGDLVLACTCHWGMAVLEGLTGHAEACDHHMAESARIAEALSSPLLRLAGDEVQVEHAFGRGDWDTGIAIGERAIALARALDQSGVLPRLLVWTALIYLGRGDLERGRQYVTEAWELSGADDLTRAPDAHRVVPAHIGLASYHMAVGEWDDAVRVGQRALGIVDRTGYTAWAVHRLLPVIAEAQLFQRDAESARATVARLRREAQALDHQLGLAWADTGDAFAEYLAGDLGRSVVLLREAAERLEKIPYLPDAARVRRQLAGRLADLGDREGAIRELRRVHEVFVKLGAQRELEKTRIQFQELGARPPARSAGAGTEALTAREVQIVRLVAEHKSNKAIGKALGISPRTVGTHLSNIYSKLEIASRMELAARAPLLLSSTDPPAH